MGAIEERIATDTRRLSDQAVYLALRSEAWDLARCLSDYEASLPAMQEEASTLR